MTHSQTFSPAPGLAPFIAQYGMVEIPEGVTASYFSPPLGLSGIIVHTETTAAMTYPKLAGHDFFTDNAVATGQITIPVYGQIIGKVKSIMVFFQPLGMHLLFGIDMATLTNTSIPLGGLLGQPAANSLMECLRANQDSAQQVAVLDAFFLRLTPACRDASKLVRVLDYIHRNKGRVSITALETYGNYHRKTLERQFRRMIGLSPKVYMHIYQFKCLINLLEATPGTTWVQLASQAGYYDQSHMSRYVKEYLNVSPNSIVKLDMQLINYLLSR